VRVRYVSEEEVKRLDPQGRSFWNVNSEDDLRRLRALLESKSGGG
jgi:molybdopterin-guanine dinucleotide biosynthesis protein A